MPFHALAVFCGSKTGKNPLYAQHAAELGKLLAQHNITLIYGGGNIGIMGILADAVMKNGGKVIGVIPKKLVEWERQHEKITELMVVEDMHTRKKTMYSLCDAAMILPGGWGTLDEFFEMLTWNQLSIHDKKIFILNSGGFFDYQIAHIQRIEEEEFIFESTLHRITIIGSPGEFLSCTR
jgi:uncharacterized protein (TIGR00730 family)